MKSVKIFVSLISVLACINHASYASTPSVKFYVSNNAQEIPLEKAYERLTSSFQSILKNNTIDLLQKEHVEQGRFKNILGTYEMASDKNRTGDNTEVFIASPYQNFSQQQIFLLAKQLANSFQQESVAVFIPSPSGIGDIVVKFKSHQPGITEIIQLINEKLPAYANAFSLHLTNTTAGYNQAKVSEVEWLGSKVDINEIKSVFPGDTISYCYGDSYLVYKNGEVQSI